MNMGEQFAHLVQGLGYSQAEGMPGVWGKPMGRDVFGGMPADVWVVGRFSAEDSRIGWSVLVRSGNTTYLTIPRSTPVSEEDMAGCASRFHDWFCEAFVHEDDPRKSVRVWRSLLRNQTVRWGAVDPVDVPEHLVFKKALPC